MNCTELENAIQKAKGLTQDEKNEYLSLSTEGIEDTTNEELLVGLLILAEEQVRNPELDVYDWEADVVQAIFRY